ncbi:MAG: biopolymer transporter ExbD [Bdellovibrionales bacterium]|nr:biopolymer transporter ExbD [Bdellovibrionales bacterium]
MSLNTAHFGAGTFNKRLVARKHRRGGGKKNLMASLSLTSMVDMFSLLVIFLLQTFSTSPELLAITKGVELPTARTGLEIKDAPVLSITQELIYLDQKEIGKTADLMKNPEPLMDKLAELRKQWVQSHPGEAFKGEINLQAHRDLPGTWISQIMGMLPSQHYGSISLAVVGGSSGG